MGVAQFRGRAGEDLAAALLALRGLRVVARNVRLAGVEVDLIAEEGPVQVLVEVRLRSRADYGGAAETLDARKRARLVRAAQALAVGGAARVRLDVVAVDLTPDGAALVHYRNALAG